MLNRNLVVVGATILNASHTHTAHTLRTNQIAKQPPAIITKIDHFEYIFYSN